MRRNLRLCAFVTAYAWLVGTPAHAEMQVKTTRIGHGVEAWYATSAAVPIIDVVLTFEGAGTASDPEGKAGRASFAAAMMGRGQAP